MPDNVCVSFSCITSRRGRWEEAAKHGHEVIESLIEWYQGQGKPLPEAIALPQNPLKVA
ncbi:MULTISPECIES: hypothetical protein [Fischerella]|uniref:hypothetical protein n=1 Tax=Fischerella TaxID=1190 RepID=UPI00031781D8|nr:MULTISPECIES: hypothetical protein [Fischerella]